VLLDRWMGSRVARSALSRSRGAFTAPSFETFRPLVYGMPRVIEEYAIAEMCVAVERPWRRHKATVSIDLVLIAYRSARITSSAQATGYADKSTERLQSMAWQQLNNKAPVARNLLVT
jgi:hypothetical protein